MINQFEHRFRIRRVLKASDDEYVAALRIYNETTPYEIKTNTNEISYWIDKKAESSPFEVLAFILYIDSEVIGLSSSIRTTQIYTQVTAAKQRQILADKHPRNQIAFGDKQIPIE